LLLLSVSLHEENLNILQFFNDTSPISVMVEVYRNSPIHFYEIVLIQMQGKALPYIWTDTLVEERFE
jgi:hypothetical protein